VAASEGLVARSRKDLEMNRQGSKIANDLPAIQDARAARTTKSGGRPATTGKGTQIGTRWHDPVAPGLSWSSVGVTRKVMGKLKVDRFLGANDWPHVFRESDTACQCSIECYIPCLNLRALQKVVPGPFQGRNQE
jgi:hypothetical protein